ncbi:orotate phosphoribosyltransferase [Xylanibacillus composti]|uniref:Orotate phosphoribosyltransferase n=1 Tax=Xylanibacillus composti TaxID=1572762 RepID=A0A8J4M1J7_9BACL|nr:orotate phosphoribosyltransferase [Xylanibacillus composti]MDT9724336.1 orotate phosphoribosyltransferase [Xylanibacillus composti]GIQ67927.1 orotate phosphoribosyltransferase [Xylanibacillus composti]
MTELSALSSSIARSLLDIGAVHLRPNEPFTWTSGIQSPIYCDNRLTLSYPEVRSAVADGFCQVIRDHYPDAEVIAGTATAGIPHAAWVADKLGLPMIYIRDKAKGHGRQNQIEGLLKPGQKTIVIEDLISTGGSSIKAAEAAREAGANVLAVVAIFTYQFAKAERGFADAGIPLHTLSNYTVLCQEALASGKIQSEDLDMLSRWREETGK